MLWEQASLTADEACATPTTPVGVAHGCREALIASGSHLILGVCSGRVASPSAAMLSRRGSHECARSASPGEAKAAAYADGCEMDGSQVSTVCMVF